MKILRTWRQGDICQQGSPIIALPPEGCGCDNANICCISPKPIDCCMFPTQEFGITYVVENLPNEIEVFWQYCPPNDPPRIDATLIKKEDGSYEHQNITVKRVDGAWILYENDLQVYGNNCLLDDKTNISTCENPEAQAISYIHDKFEDIYNYEWTFEDVSRSGILIRESLCVWRDPVASGIWPDGGIGILYYSTGELSDGDIYYGWKIDAGGDFLSPANQTPRGNSPVGDYIDTGGLYEGAVLTVLPPP